jgi:putative transposase
MRLFETDADYRALIDSLVDAQTRVPLRMLAFCVMPNHFHLVVWPSEDGQVSEYMRLATGTHAVRWHVAHGTLGLGAVYQGRFRAFPIQADRHFYNVCRYVEQNPIRAKLVDRAEEWAWSSASARCRKCNLIELAPWPIPQPTDWLDYVNQCPEDEELRAIRKSVRRSRPLGAPAWMEHQALKLDLGRTLTRRHSD